MGAVKILQIVGFKNSGKTALLSRLIGIAKENGKAVSAIKHHGHGGPPEMPPGTADSTRFFDAGAESSIVCGGGVIQLHQRQRDSGLDSLIPMALMAKPDFILVEGYKKAEYDKIVLVRSEEDWVELKRLQGIILVLAPEGLRMGEVETMERNGAQELENWFLKWMEGEKDESI
ncbi:molybdopterin-guanine dinucleotide biosynthesis protein B [Planomicrobium sp. CPCC 101110]|uniref:molybdopterin-guanine dinucleotide biosynthesis protein B n=1 Tax=Planomicrobium sp. CPCC 101110 TaxID=2599619 RepID=UPI0011B49CB7|nr:molybdopterin-guanine dinucleotide biosynthesis protein B [Planomicrobium sp. CPCC 101110]TWT27208.1 molybdopterin-guanine dinucleotide biosynthesis protein B [Planomicrobium sp. CPCC 101110]